MGILSTPSLGYFPHLLHGFIPALHTGLGPALLFLDFFLRSHAWTIAIIPKNVNTYFILFLLLFLSQIRPVSHPNPLPDIIDLLENFGLLTSHPQSIDVQHKVKFFLPSPHVRSRFLVALDSLPPLLRFHLCLSRRLLSFRLG